MFMVVTTDGCRVYDNKGSGLTESAAQEDAERRNAKAAQMGLKVRYETTEFSGLKN